MPKSAYSTIAVKNRASLVIKGRTDEIRRLLNFIENKLSDTERIETFTFAEESKREYDRKFDVMFPEEHIGDIYVPKSKV